MLGKYLLQTYKYIVKKETIIEKLDFPKYSVFLFLNYCTYLKLLQIKFLHYILSTMVYNSTWFTLYQCLIQMSKFLLEKIENVEKIYI